MQTLALIGSSVFPALIGMAIANARQKTGSPKIPSMNMGGGTFFLKTWAVASVTAILSVLSLNLLGVSESTASGLGALVFPAIVSTYFAKNLLSSQK